MGIAVARHLGPENYGILSHAVTIYAVALIIVCLGLDEIVSIRILQNNDDKNNNGLLAGTTFFLKSVSSIAIYIMLALISIIFFQGSTLYTVLIINLALLFQPLSIFTIIFLSRAEGKYTSISRIISYTVSALFKIYFIIIDADIIWFAAATFLDYSLLYVIIFLMYKKKKYSYSHFKVSKKYIKELLKEVPNVFMSVLFYTGYLKISILLITYLYSPYQSGIYTAAIRIIEAFYLVPAIIVSSLYPAIVNSKNISEIEYKKRLSKLFTFIFTPFLLLSIIIYFLSSFIINLLYGYSYAESSTVLSITIWAVPFIAFYTVTSRYLIIEKMLKQLLSRSLLSLMLLIIFSLLLNENYGITGISAAFPISALISFFVIDYFFAATRELFFIKLKSIFFPLIYIYNVIKIK